MNVEQNFGVILTDVEILLDVDILKMSDFYNKCLYTKVTTEVSHCEQRSESFY